MPEGTEVSRNRRLILHQQDVNLWTATWQPHEFTTAGAKSGRRMFMHAAPRSHTGLVSRELGVALSLLHMSPEVNRVLRVKLQQPSELGTQNGRDPVSGFGAF